MVVRSRQENNRKLSVRETNRCLKPQSSPSGPSRPWRVSRLDQQPLDCLNQLAVLKRFREVLLLAGVAWSCGSLRRADNHARYFRPGFRIPTLSRGLVLVQNDNVRGFRQSVRCGSAVTANPLDL